MKSWPPPPPARPTREHAPSVPSLPPPSFDAAAPRRAGPRDSQVQRASWRHAPTVRLQVPLTRAQAARKQALWLLLACAVGAGGTHLVWFSLRLVRSQFTTSQPSQGTAEIRGRRQPASGVASAAEPKDASGPLVIQPIEIQGAAGGASDARSQGRAAAIKGTRGLRYIPRRSDVLRSFREVEPSVAACIRPGAVARVQVTFAGRSGRVLRAKVLGQTDRATVACVAHATGRAAVDAFVSKRYVVKHTFKR